MIIQEHYFIEGHEFIHTISNTGRYIVRDGINYNEAYDPVEFNRQYTEGEPLPSEELINILTDKAEAYDILIGGSEE